MKKFFPPKRHPAKAAPRQSGGNFLNQGATNDQGFIMIVVMVISLLLIVLGSGLAILGIYQNRLYDQILAKQQALHVAEAGVNYYRWHLAHAATDYMDGTGADPGGGGEPYGPYEHAYVAPSSGVTGRYSLEITPPILGSSIVTIKSTGWTDAHPLIKREVEVRYGIPSFAHYSFLTHEDTWFGATEAVVGEMHANGGIRMDGTNESLVASARDNFDCPATFGCDTQLTCLSPCTWQAASSSCSCPGVWGAGSGASFWRDPVPVVDFDGVTMDLDVLRFRATSSCGKFIVNNPNKGYHITFNNDGSFDAWLVTSLAAGIKQKDDDWTDWRDPQGFETVPEQYQNQGAATHCAIPTNGIIFVEDGDVWVDGVVRGRVTLAAATLPDNINKRRNIFINGNLTYAARDGTNILGLIAQNNIKVPNYAPNTLTIDGFLLAQNGRVFYNYYATSSHSVKSSIEVYGGILTRKNWTWHWTSGGAVIDGYQNTATIYDTYAAYAPPPYFPATGEYAFISWKEE